MLAILIKQEAIAYGIGQADNHEIDRINILQASFLAMHRALDELIAKSGSPPELLLIDGNRFRPFENIPHVCIVKGDSKYASIAAASILAKTCRDALITSLSATYPHYGWEANAGYPTPKHKAAIAAHGITPLHRLSFKMS
jgi:ribonuclease HII